MQNTLGRSRPLIWNSYRRAAVRTGPDMDCTNCSHCAHSSSNMTRDSGMAGDALERWPGSQLTENGVTVDRLKAEIKKLRRLVKKKDMIIDTLTEKLLKLQGRRHDRDSLYNPRGVVKDFDSLSLQKSPTLCVLPLPHANRNHLPIVTDFEASPSTALSLEHRRDDDGDSLVLSNDTFTVPSSDLQESSNRTEEHDIFVVESFARKSISTDPDWKPSLPPSYCLKANRPEIIRRIEKRQAAITAASTLRHIVAEEKKEAARAVVQGKCSFSCVKNSLQMDATLVKAFPEVDMANLTKRSLRGTSGYKEGTVEEKRRMDAAAAKIIARSFSESTRVAALRHSASIR